MERIAIVGCGGSGKSHVARELARCLRVPLTHLDGIYYDQDWNTVPPDQFRAAQEELVSRPAWIIEGNYAGTLPVRLAAADTVIIMDFPAITCLRGVAQRRLRHGGGQHPGIGVYDRINWGFIRYILTYRRTMLPRVHQLITDHAHTAEVIVLRTRAQAQRLLADVSRATATTISPATPGDAHTSA